MMDDMLAGISKEVEKVEKKLADKEKKKKLNILN